MAPTVVPGIVPLVVAKPKIITGNFVPAGPKPVGALPGLAVAPVTAASAAAAAAAAQAQNAAAAAARVTSLESAIEADPYDITAWDGRLKEAIQAGTATEVFERAVKQLPFAARMWAGYAECAELQETAQAMAVYQRCLQQVPNLDLWTTYLGFCKRFLPLEDVLRAYQRAVDLLGTDTRAGLLWAEYISLLKHTYNTQQKKENPDAEVSGKLLAEDASPVEAARRSLKPALKKRIEGTKAADLSDDEFLRVGEVLKIDVELLRRIFQRAVSTAHSALEKLWIGYEQFEKSLGNPPMAQKLLGEHMPRFVRAKASFKELQTLYGGVDHFAIAVPLQQKNAAQQGKLMDKWRRVLQFERTNPLRLGRKDLQARVTLVYQQAALACAFHAELWHDFAEWLDLGGQREEATAVLRRAVERFLPSELTLRLLVAQRHELNEVPPSAASLEAADEEYEKLLNDMPKPCPLALINYLSYLRRQRGAGEFRSAFLEATENSPHCTWEVYLFAAQTEYHVFGSEDAAAKVFRLGLERYGEREPSLLAAYVNFLVGANDLRGARAELSRGVLDRLQAAVRDRMSNRSDPRLHDSLAFLWQKWSRLERYFGDAVAVQRMAAFRDEEFRNLQRDQDVEEDAVVETPDALGLSMTIRQVEEGFRFGHLVPQASSAPTPPKATPAARQGDSTAPAPTPAAAATAAPAAAASSAAAGGATPPAKTAAAEPAAAAAAADAAGAARGSSGTSAACSTAATAQSGPLVDQAVAEATDEHRRFAGSSPGSGLSVHIARPDVSKMLAFRPALDVVGCKKAAAGGSAGGAGAGGAGAGPGAAGDGAVGSTASPPVGTDPRVAVAAARGGITDVEEQVPLPTMIPKCLQDLLAVLPARPLKGAKPDVDYLLTVLQTVAIPPIPVKELERFRYDSLRLLKEEDNALLRRRGLVKDEFDLDGGSGFFSSRPTIYRERLQAKRQRLQEEMSGGGVKLEAGPP